MAGASMGAHAAWVHLCEQKLDLSIISLSLLSFSLSFSRRCVEQRVSLVTSVDRDEWVWKEGMDGRMKAAEGCGVEGHLSREMPSEEWVITHQASNYTHTHVCTCTGTALRSWLEADTSHIQAHIRGFQHSGLRIWDSVWHVNKHQIQT